MKRDDAIELLGGYDNVCHYVGVGIGTVYNWPEDLSHIMEIKVCGGAILKVSDHLEKGEKMVAERILSDLVYLCSDKRYRCLVKNE